MMSATPTNDTKWIKPFVTGIIATLAASHLVPKILSKKRNKTSRSISNSSQPLVNSQTLQQQQQQQPQSSTQIFDSPTLDQRILRKAETAIQQRTSQLIVVVERCTNDHNYSAILRTAEALGIQHVYIIDPQACNSTLKQLNNDGTEVIGNGNQQNPNQPVQDEQGNVKLCRSTGQHVKQYSQSEVKDRAQHHLFAQRAVEWLNVKEFETTKECIDELKNNGYHIWSTDLSQVAVCLTKDALMEDDHHNFGIDTLAEEYNVIPEKLAIVFGTEAVGCTTEILNASDKRVYLPLRGFADSLNLSVATALVIHQLFTLDPSIIGSMPHQERIELRRQWYSKLASQRLLSKIDKKKRRRIKTEIQQYSELEWRINNPDNKEYAPLNSFQVAKVEKLYSLRAELKEIDDDLKMKSLQAVEDLVLNPPEPLGDMRRHDGHRATYAGKNTKRSQGWKDMPATSYVRSVNLSSASFFRDRVKESNDNGDNE